MSFEESVMKKAIEKARQTMNEDQGGPFGAAIIDDNGKILSVASNSVLSDHDATAHAEINAIREASKVKASHDLSGCTLYTTAYPCPMCLGAIIWANIKTLVYGCRAQDADEIGFRDEYIYDFIEKGRQDDRVINVKEKYRAQCLDLFKEYQEKNKTMY